MKLSLILCGVLGSTLYLCGWLPGASREVSGDAVVHYHGNGRNKSWIEYVDGRREGAASEWYASGQLREQGLYREDRRDGRWTFWLADGTVDAARSGLYDRGERVGD